MKTIARLKDEARRHEQAENWTGAIDAYMRVITLGDEADGDGDRELPLFNRIGDLFVRLGQPVEAVSYYEDAADRYAEAGLYNNAIALCNKALRYLPERVALYRKLGRLSAAQGFHTDARRWFLDYAEAMFRQGSEDDAFSALGELAALSDDPATRLLLGRRLQARGRTADAVVELTRAYGAYRAAGDAETADALHAEILALDTEADPDAALAAEAAAAAIAAAADDAAEGGADEALGATTDSVAAVDHGVTRSAEAAAKGGAGVDTGGLDVEDAAYGGADAARVAASLLAELEATAHAAPDGAPDAAGLLDGFEATDLGGATDPDAAAVHVFDARADLSDLPDLGPAGGAGAPAADDVAADLPVLDFGGAPTGGGASVDLHAGLAAAWQELEAGHHDSARATLDTLHERLAAAARWDDAAAAIGARIELDPDAVALHRQRVEYARNTGDPALLAEGLEALADTLDRTGAPGHAAAVREQLGEVPEGTDATAHQDPARHAAAPGAPASAAPSAARDAPASAADPAPAGLAAEPTDAGGYVDLAAMFAEEPAKETRFFVEEKAPTGDEDLDFAELLAQFKTQLSKNLDREDAGSHYDLGLAFKDMGLLDEAIGAFQVALRAGDARLGIFEELGQCFVLKGQHGIAIKILRRALELQPADEMELIGVYYFLGRAAEALDRRDDARDAYERVIALDLAFQDVEQRLARL